MSSESVPPNGSVSEVLEDEQTLLDSDQTLADDDQTASDSDQTAADREQAAADSDQAASDRDLAHGGDPAAHDSSRELRSRTARQRQYSAHGRVAAADARDEISHARDLSAWARDRNAEQRAHARALQDLGSLGEGSESTRRAKQDRANAAADRAGAAEARARAAADREQATNDRAQATRDVLQAQAERDALLDRLAVAEDDGLTGTRSRAMGLEDLDREIARARRMMTPLVVAYVDVVGLKAVNDTHGHAAGDALLQGAVNAIRAHMRSYDLIVRIGGDEFLAVMAGASIGHARARFTTIGTVLAAESNPSEIKVGFAALEPDDSAAEMIGRADAELPPGNRR